MADKKEDLFDFPDIELEEKDLKQEDYTCSATQAFDAVFQCYSMYQSPFAYLLSDKFLTFLISPQLALGEQALNYYRYGAKKDCSGKWDYFKLCLSTKTKSPLEAKVRAVLQGMAWHGIYKKWSFLSLYTEPASVALETLG